MYCPKCGTKNDDNAFKCTKCGVVLKKVPAGKKTKTTVVVLVIVGIAFFLFAVIGILAAIAIPQFLEFKVRARNAVAQAEVQNACNAAAAFFIDNPDKTITLDDLKEQGIAANPDIELSIEDGTMENLTIRAKHSKGNKVYLADRDCNIQEIQP